MTEDKRLDDLFAVARNEAPKVSYSQTKSTFLKAIGLGMFGAPGLKWAGLSTKLKIIIMLSSVTLGIAISLGIVYFGNTAPSGNNESQTLITENKEISVEADGSKQTIYYDDDTNIVRIVKTPAKPERLKPLETLSMERVAPKIDSDSKQIVPVLKKATPTDSIRKVAGKKTFVIQRNTTDLEMEKIQQEAEKAGIDFRYSVLVWKGKVKRCKLYASLTTDDCKCCEYMVELKGRFTKIISWTEDEDGKAIELFM